MFHFCGYTFLNSSQINTFIIMWAHKKKHIVYIGCEMGFKGKTYEFDILIEH
jgi:hypothetical protein